MTEKGVQLFHTHPIGKKNTLEHWLVEDIMKLSNELHTTENFDLIETQIWSKYFETGTIAGIKNAVDWRGRKAIKLFL